MISYYGFLSLKQIAPIIIFIICLCTLQTNSQNFSDSEKIILYNGLGGIVGRTINNYGWEHPDTYLSKAYQGPKTMTIEFSAYGEMLYNRFYSSIIKIGYCEREYSFNFDEKNSAGEIVGTKTMIEDIHFLRFSAAEKLKYDIPHYSFYLYAGLRYDLQIAKSVDDDFMNVLGHNSSYGLTSGIGLEFNFSGCAVFFEYYYNPDFKKTYSSPDGYVRNTEIGILVGIGGRRKTFK